MKLNKEGEEFFKKELVNEMMRQFTVSGEIHITKLQIDTLMVTAAMLFGNKEIDPPFDIVKA